MYLIQKDGTDEPIYKAPMQMQTFLLKYGDQTGNQCKYALTTFVMLKIISESG